MHYAMIKDISISPFLPLSVYIFILKKKTNKAVKTGVNHHSRTNKTILFLKYKTVNKTNQKHLTHDLYFPRELKVAGPLSTQKVGVN